MFLELDRTDRFNQLNRKFLLPKKIIFEIELKIIGYNRKNRLEPKIIEYKRKIG